MEELPPSNILENLINRKNEIENLILFHSDFLAKAPEGSLRIKTNHGKMQFYHSTENNKNGRYIKKENHSLIQCLAQKEYYEKLQKALYKEAKELCRIINFLKQDELLKVYSSLKNGTKQQISPITLENENYAELWKNISYPKKPFYENHPCFITSTGLNVRSKSEMLIAQTLDSLGIPYRYEFPLKVHAEKGVFKTFHPDFLCLNIKTRKEFYWEHFGLLENQEYLLSAIQKLAVYEKNGIIQGKNLIVTMESQTSPISTASITKLAQAFLL